MSDAAGIVFDGQRVRLDELVPMRSIRFVESCGLCPWQSDPLPIAWARRARVQHHRKHHADPAQAGEKETTCST